jgi:hypothetical protein
MLSVADVITGAVALYGAGLSTYVAYRQWSRDKPKLVVDIHFGYEHDPPESAPDGPVVPVFIIEAVNPGPRPVEVRIAGVLKGDREIYPPVFHVAPGPLPKLLSDGESIRFLFRSEQDVPDHKRMEVDRVFVRAGLERFEAEPPEWLRPLRIVRRWPYG